MYRNKLKTTPEQIEKLMALNEKDYIKDQSLLLKSISILGLTILGFVLHSIIHVDAAVIAMTGATLLMLIGVKEHDIEDVFAHVEWVTIFFFAGLFVLVGGLIDIGLISSLAKEVIGVTNGDIGFAAILILWVSASHLRQSTTSLCRYDDSSYSRLSYRTRTICRFSANRSTMVGVISWSLLRGNGTLIGASANVVVAGIAKREGHAFSYMDF